MVETTKVLVEILREIVFGFDHLFFVGFHLCNAAKPVGKLHLVQSACILDRELDGS